MSAEKVAELIVWYVKRNSTLRDRVGSFQALHEHVDANMVLLRQAELEGYTYADLSRDDFALANEITAIVDRRLAWCKYCGHREGDKVTDDLPGLPKRFGPIINGECDLCRMGRELAEADQ